MSALPSIRRAGKRPRRSRFGTARSRLRLIEPMLILGAKLAMGERATFVTAGFLELSLTELARRLSRDSGVAERTLWRWYSAVFNSGMKGLANQGRRDAGIPRRLSRLLRAARLRAAARLRHHVRPEGVS
jgi:hypothetical protein